MAIGNATHQRHRHHGQTIGNGAEQIHQHRRGMLLGEGIGHEPWNPEAEAVEAGRDAQVQQAEQPQAPIAPDCPQAMDRGAGSPTLKALPLQRLLEGLSLLGPEPEGLPRPARQPPPHHHRHHDRRQGLEQEQPTPAGQPQEAMHRQQGR